MKFTTPALVAALAAPSMIDAFSFLTPFGLRRPMVVWSPSEVFKETESLIDKSFTQTSPRYEITDNNEKFQIAVDVPGFKAEDIKISVDDDNGFLSIKGEREASGDTYRFSSKFSQSFSLAKEVDLDKFTANLENGVLTVSAPKDVKKIEESVRSIPITEEEAKAEPVAVEKKAEVKEKKEEAATA